MKRQTLALSFSLIMLISGASAGSITEWEGVDSFIDSFEDKRDAICGSMVSYAFVGCYGYDGSEYATNDAITAHQDVYGDTIVWEDTRKTVIEESRSHINQTYGIAQAKAKFEALQAFKNGTSQSNATEIASNKVKDLYSSQQMRVVRWKNREVIQLNRSINAIQKTPDLSVKEVYDLHNMNNGCFGESLSDWDSTFTGEFRINDVDVQLYNGTFVDSYAVDAGVNGNSGCYNEGYVNVIDGFFSSTNVGITARSYDRDNYTEALNGDAYANLDSNLDEKRTAALNNVNSLVDSIYNNLNPDEVDISDAAGPLETLLYASTNYESTGYYDYLSLSAEQMGYATNNTYAFRVRWNNTGEPEKTATGQLFIESGAFNNSIEVGKTYTVTNEYVEFVHAQDSGKATTTRITGTFTPLNMTNAQTGEQVNSTTLQSTRFYTESTQDLLDQIKRYMKSQEDVKDDPLLGGALSGTAGFINDLLAAAGLSDVKIPNGATVGLFAALIVALALALA